MNCMDVWWWHTIECWMLNGNVDKNLGQWNYSCPTYLKSHEIGRMPLTFSLFFQHTVLFPIKKIISIFILWLHSFVDSLRCQRLNDNFSTICSTSTYFHCCIVCGSHATWVHVFRIPWCFLNYFTPRPNVHMHENLSNSFGGTHSRELPHTKLSFTSKKTENISIAQDNLLLLGVSRKSKWKKKKFVYQFWRLNGIEIKKSKRRNAEKSQRNQTIFWTSHDFCATPLLFGAHDFEF